MNFLKLRKDVKDMKRLEHILGILAEEEYHHVIKKVAFGHPSLLKKKKLKKKNMGTPEDVRKLLEKLGPTFIKLGQLLSLRPDLVNHTYSEEFKKLQDGVKPFPYAQVKQIIESELGKPLNKLFKKFDEKSFSAASISQVHKAVLNNGKDVVVKIQRPKTKEIMEADIDIMDHIAEILQKHEEFKNLNPKEIVREFKDYTERELDFRFEERNIRKFYEYFKTWDDITIPEPYHDYTTQKVLTMQLMEGVKLENKKELKKHKYNQKRIAKNIFGSIIYQMFDLGFFHADAHPGNILIARGEKIVFLDFGIIGFMSPELQRNTLKMLLALVDGDSKATLREFIHMSNVTNESNVPDFMRESELLINDWYGTTYREVRFTVLIYEIIKKATQHNIEVSPDVILIAKALLTAEGTGAELDSDFNIVKEAKPLLNKIIAKKFSPKNLMKDAKKELMAIDNLIHEIPETAGKVIKKIEEGKIEIQIPKKELRELEATIDRNSTKRALAFLLVVTFFGSGILAQLEKEPYLLGFAMSRLGLALTVFLVIWLARIFLKERKLDKGVK